LRVFLPLAAVTFVTGVLYGIWNVIDHGRIPNGVVVLLLFSVVVFLVGLVSEQISALRFEGRQ
jgi:Flp pilus assembly protein protease CpaA